MTTPREQLRRQRQAAHAEQRNRPAILEEAEANAADVRRGLNARVRWALVADGMRHEQIDLTRAARLVGDDVPPQELHSALMAAAGRMRRTGGIRGGRITERGKTL